MPKEVNTSVAEPRVPDAEADEPGELAISPNTPAKEPAAPTFEPMAASGDGGEDDDDLADRMSGMAGRDFVQAFPQASGKPDEDSSAASTAVMYQKTQDTLSKWTTSFTSWGRRQTQELKSGNAFQKMKQVVTEQFKPGSKTVDNELIAKIQTVKEAEHDLRVLIELTKDVGSTMKRATDAQLALAACFAHLSETSKGAAPDLSFHQRVQDLMAKNATGLIETLGYFNSQIKVFIKDKITPTWKLVLEYENARISYDASRLNYESFKETQSPKLPAAEAKFLQAYNTMSDARTATWDGLCQVEEEKVTMFKSQLEAMKYAVEMFVRGNHAGLEDAMARLTSTTGGEGASELAAASGAHGATGLGDGNSAPF